MQFCNVIPAGFKFSVWVWQPHAMPQVMHHASSASWNKSITPTEKKKLQIENHKTYHAYTSGLLEHHMGPQGDSWLSSVWAGCTGCAHHKQYRCKPICDLASGLKVSPCLSSMLVQWVWEIKDSFVLSANKTDFQYFKAHCPASNS